MNIKQSNAIKLTSLFQSHILMLCTSWATSVHFIFTTCVLFDGVSSILLMELLTKSKVVFLNTPSQISKLLTGSFCSPRVCHVSIAHFIFQTFLPVQVHLPQGHLFNLCIAVFWLSALKGRSGPQKPRSIRTRYFSIKCYFYASESQTVLCVGYLTFPWKTSLDL